MKVVTTSLMLPLILSWSITQEFYSFTVQFVSNTVHVTDDVTN